MLMTTPYNGAQKNLMKVCVIHKKWLNNMILVLNQEKSNFHNTIRLKQTSIVNNKLSKKQLEKTFKNQNCNALFRASQYNEPGTAQIIDIFELTCIERVLLAFQTTYPKKNHVRYRPHFSQATHLFFQLARLLGQYLYSNDSLETTVQHHKRDLLHLHIVLALEILFSVVASIKRKRWFGLS